MFIETNSYCDGCVWLVEDSLSTDEDWYCSCQNKNSDNYLCREDDLSWLYKGETCEDKEL